MTIKDQFNETINYIRKHTQAKPSLGIVLGTGLGKLADAIETTKTLAYNFIPHFPISTVESHFGKLIFGKIGEVEVVAMQGRLHYYEGYNMFQITYPIRIMKMLGIKTLCLSNAAGALNPKYRKGDLMVIEDHINLLPENPLRGQNLEEFGPRFPDMSQPYSKVLIEKAFSIAAEEQISLHKGVYVAVQGPNLETRAEYRYLRTIGGDVVGMSTVPECIVANHMGIQTFAISVITDECDPDNLTPITVQEIIETAQAAEPKLVKILLRLIQES
ncbi:MAG: purine-nucleoside phosphorylase [Bacteroidia bacterium]|nr:purine-nucleoside phosphorylase [Bacteroidia bacterium]